MQRGFGVVPGLMLGMLLVGAPTLSWSQSEGEKIAYAYGTVQKVTAHSLVIREYDEDADDDEAMEVTYALRPTTELKEVRAWTDIAVDDEVDVEYVQKGAKRVSTRVSVWKSESTADAAGTGIDINAL